MFTLPLLSARICTLEPLPVWMLTPLYGTMVPPVIYAFAPSNWMGYVVLSATF